MSDDINERLEQWGATETPPPDAAFSDRLEQDLRSAMYFRAPAMGRGDRGGRRWFPRPALVVGCVVLLVGGVAWWTQRPDASTRTVAVDTATDTELTFADGSRQPADAGEVLPEGTRVDVGPEGSAVIAGVVLDPGDRALIVDGIIELLARATATPVPSPAPPAPTASDVPTPTPVPPPSGPTPTTDTPTPRATPTPTVGVTPTPGPPAPSDRPAFVIDLGATAAGDALVLAWTVTGAPPELLGWEVVALTGDRRRTVAVIRDPDVRDLTVTGPRADGYRVLARGEDTILAESDIVAP